MLAGTFTEMNPLKCNLSILAGREFLFYSAIFEPTWMSCEIDRRGPAYDL